MAGVTAGGRARGGFPVVGCVAALVGSPCCWCCSQRGRHGGEAIPGPLPRRCVGAVSDGVCGRSAQTRVSSARLRGAECPSAPYPFVREKVFWA